MAEPPSIKIRNYNVEFEFVEFKTFLARISMDDPDFLNLFERYFKNPINEIRTPHFVRDKIKQITNCNSD